MKKTLLIIWLFFSLVSNSQTTTEIFSKANNLYKNGEYEKAMELYYSFGEKGLESADLYFNLANCYYKLNKVAPSIYYYEKALKINPTHQDAIANLIFAKRMTIDVIEELPKTFLQRFSVAVIQKLPFDTWALIAVVASFLVTVLFLLYRFSFSSKKKLFYFNTTILSVVILLITVFFAFKNYDIVQKNRTAIIFAEKIKIKNAPTIKGNAVFELHEGTKVIILDELDNWKKIKIADGKIGWIPTEDLKEI